MPALHKRLLLTCLVGVCGCSSSGQLSRNSVADFPSPALPPGEQTSKQAPAQRYVPAPPVVAVTHRMPPKSNSAGQADQLGNKADTLNPGDPLDQNDVANIGAPVRSPGGQARLITDLSLARSQISPLPAPATPAAIEPTVDTDSVPEQLTNECAPLEPGMIDVVQLNLPSVLAAIDNQHPAVGFVRWQVQQAYAELAQAKALWLPSIQPGFSFHRRDGNYQASSGEIVDVDRNSFQYGLGTGATGAGTVPRPGLVARFHTADAIFQPKITEKTAWARQHAAGATINRQLLTAGIAYLDLVRAHQNQRIVEESKNRYSELTTITIDFAETGQGLQSDADRMRTELALVENRLAAARERTAMATANLAQAISIDPTSNIMPMDAFAVPLEMVSPTADKCSLIQTALAKRPELKESQALVAAACEAYRREKFAPFVPSVLLGFSTGGFGGGLRSDLANIDNRYDFDALMSWQVRNLGFGDKAARRQRLAQMQQAKFEKLRIMDQVAREASEAHAQVEFRQQQVQITRGAVGTASESHRRNLERIRDAQGLPLEVLQSVDALEVAQRAHLQAIIGYNQAQLNLQWALGWPVSAAVTAQH